MIRPHHEWTEADGDVLWWLWPIEEAPWVGTPLCCGHTIEARVDLRASGSSTEGLVTMQVCGWPFDDEDLHRVYWTRLPDTCELDDLIRKQIRE